MMYSGLKIIHRLRRMLCIMILYILMNDQLIPFQKKKKKMIDEWRKDICRFPTKLDGQNCAAQLKPTYFPCVVINLLWSLCTPTAHATDSIGIYNMTLNYSGNFFCTFVWYTHTHTTLLCIMLVTGFLGWVVYLFHVLYWLFNKSP